MYSETHVYLRQYCFLSDSRNVFAVGVVFLVNIKLCMSHIQFMDKFFGCQCIMINYINYNCFLYSVLLQNKRKHVLQIDKCMLKTFNKWELSCWPKEYKRLPKIKQLFKADISTLLKRIKPNVLSVQLYYVIDKRQITRW